MKKITALVLIIGVAIFVMHGCNGIEPPPPDEDPELQQTVFVEYYMFEGCQHCANIKPILEQLVDEYSREEMILVELDIVSFTENRQRFDWYALTPPGVPKIMFNGLIDSIVGLSTYPIIKSKIEAQLAMKPVVELQASRTFVDDSNIFSGTVKNIGSDTLTNLVVNGMAFMDRGKTGFHYSVTDIFEDEKETINSLSPGQEVDFSITVEGLDWDGDNLNGVIFVQAVEHAQKAIKQSVFLE